MATDKKEELEKYYTKKQFLLLIRELQKADYIKIMQPEKNQALTKHFNKITALQNNFYRFYDLQKSSSVEELF